MNLEFSDDQIMLQDSVNRLIAERYTLDQRAGYASQPEGWSREMWGRIVALGLTMLPFAEDVGGLGLGSVETMIVGEAFGRGLVVEPYLPSVVLAGTAIAAAGTPEQKQRWLPGIAAGETIPAFAPGAALVITRQDEGWELSGEARIVLGGDSAQLLVLHTDGRLFILPAAAPGLTVRGYRLHGGGGAADIALAGVRVSDDASMDGERAAARAIQAGIAFLAAEASGAMQAALDLTVDYLKTREQFGKPIGANQALQHRAAEMMVEVEQARSAAIYAALLADVSEPVERARGFAAVKAVIAKSARFVAQNAVQLHGGIGVSEEHAIGHYFRRLTAIGSLLA